MSEEHLSNPEVGECKEEMCSKVEAPEEKKESEPESHPSLQFLYDVAAKTGVTPQQIIAIAKAFCKADEQIIVPLCQVIDSL